MSHRYLRIDPSLPMCWEDLDTLRFGFDRAELRLRQPSTASQRLIAELRSGVRADRLIDIANQCGVMPRERQNLLDRLAPVLLHTPFLLESPVASRPQTPNLRVTGTGPFAATLRTLCEEATTTDEHQPEIVVLVANFLPPLDAAQRLLSEHTPHVLVQLCDRSVAIGPLVAPSGHPCLTCLELHLREREPERQFLGMQLAEEQPATDMAEHAVRIAPMLLAAVAQWQLGDSELIARQQRFRVRAAQLGLEPEITQVQPHQACGCTSLRESTLLAGTAAA